MDEPRILIVEDDEEYARTVKEFLELKGYSILVANDESDGRRQMETQPLDLAIVDLWLKQDEEDENSPSGLNLVTGARPDLKKIVLTSHPNIETTRKTLGSLLNGKPAAVGYIYKEDGLEELLKAIRLALLSVDPVVENNILKEFGVSGTVALNNRIKEVGTDRAFNLLQRSFENASDEFTKLGEDESRRASQLHFTGLVASFLGVATILIGVGFVLAGSIKGGVISLIASVITNAINALFSIREDKAHKRMRTFLEQLLEMQHDSTLLRVAESLGSTRDREIYKKKILDNLLELDKPRRGRR